MWLRVALLGGVFAAFVANGVAGQGEPSRALADLLEEVRGMRAEIQQAAAASVQVQLVTARLTLQESRLTTLAHQRDTLHAQMADVELKLAPLVDQIEQAQSNNSEILAPLRRTIEQLQRRAGETRTRGEALSRQIAAEETRWREYNARLTELERATQRPR